MSVYDFNGADVSPLPSPWASVTGFGTLRRVSNQCANSAGGDTDAAMRRTDTSATRSIVEYRSGTFDGGPAFLDSSGNGYISTNYAGDHVEIYTVTAGPNYSRIDPGGGTVAFVAGENAELRIDGNDIVFLKGATEVLRFADTTFRTGLTPALFMFAGDLRLDNHSDGVSGSTVSPSGLASAAVFGTTVVSNAGTQTISPSGIASAAVFGTAVVTKPVASAGVPSAVVYGTATVQVTLEQISPTGLASAAAYGSATITVTVEAISATGIASAAAFGTATIGNVAAKTISPSGIASAAVYGTATFSSVAPSNQTLSPSGIASAAQVGSPTVQVTLESISPTGVVSLRRVGVPQILGGALTPVISLPVPRATTQQTTIRTLSYAVGGKELPYPAYRDLRNRRGRRFLEQPGHNPFAGLDEED